MTTLARRLGLIDWKLEVENERVKAYRNTQGPGEPAVLRTLKLIENEIGSSNPAERQRGLRNRAIVSLLYYLGLRRGMAMSISLSDLEMDRNLVQTLEKGGGAQKSPRTMPVKVTESIRAWLGVRPDDVCADELGDPLFCGLDENAAHVRLSGESVRRMLRRYGGILGVTIRPHGLRHSAITEVLKKTNGNVRAAQKFSGHASVETVVVYDDNRKDEQGAMANLLAGE